MIHAGSDVNGQKCIAYISGNRAQQDHGYHDAKEHTDDKRVNKAEPVYALLYVPNLVRAMHGKNSTTYGIKDV